MQFSTYEKATAESSVQVVQRWILARLRHTVLANVHAADAAITGLLASLNNRAFQKLDGSRASLFASLDAPALSPLPAQPWQWATFKTVKVHIDYHVEVDSHRYSVSHSLVGLALEARITDALVEVLHRGQLVACHARSARRGGFTTRDEHMPAAHRAHKQWTPERLIHWGASIGVNTGQFVAQLLQRFRHPEHGYRSCLGLLSLAKRYGPQRLEAACTLALELGARHYRHVRDILANGRDLIARAVPEPDWVAPAHDNLRGAAITTEHTAYKQIAMKDFPMMMNNTLAQLRELKLAGMALAIEEQLSSSASTALCFEERLALMVDREVHHRGDKRRAGLLKKAGLRYPQACIEEVDGRAGRGFERSALTSLALSRWIDDGTAILISGATGSGKSWLACALAQYACRRGHSALYLRTPRLPEELRVLHGNGGFARWLAAVARTQVLVLDDWGLAALDGPTRSDLLEVIDDRAGARPTIVTS